MPSQTELVDRLVRIYDRAAADIRNTIVSRGTSFGREEALLRQIDAILRGLASDGDLIIDDLVVEAYSASSREAANAIEATEVDTERAFGLIDRRAIEALAIRSKDDLRKGLSLARGDIQQLVRSTQLTEPADVETRDRISQAIATGESPDALARALRPLVREGAISAEDATSLTNVLADVRIQVGGATFQIKNYAKLVANTMRREASTVALVPVLTTRNWKPEWKTSAARSAPVRAVHTWSTTLAPV